ncbi:MAG: 50S ribosomal protein L10 [archaeon]|nr:50S ribosomal protein L10 [archaeon]
MQVTLKSRRVEKERTIQRILSLAKNYKTIAISKLHKVRTTQLMELRRRFRKDMEIMVIKNKLASIAFKKTGLNKVEDFVDELKGQSALIFTNIDPFKLYMLLEKSKVNLPARPGDMATEDIVIPAGNTGIPPGPVLSEFKEAKIPTRIDTGSVWVSKDTIVAKEGDLILPKLASLLSRLGIKPVRAGLSVSAAWYDGSIFHEKDMMIDLDEYKCSIQDAYLNAKALAIGASYPTRETLPLIIRRFEAEARSLAIASGYISKEVIVDILMKYNNEAMVLYSKLRDRGYT